MTTDHGIDTGEHTPIRSVPYRLAPAWKEQLRLKVLFLLQQGIARPSLSPWSKPNGSSQEARWLCSPGH